MIAKMFDKDGDGILNTKERAAADEAMKNVSLIHFGNSLIIVTKNRESTKNSLGELNSLALFGPTGLCKSAVLLSMQTTLEE